MDIALQNTELGIVDSYWEKLRTLSKMARLNLASRLTYSVYEEETASTRRVAKIKNRRNVPTDSELQAYFEGKVPPSIPEQEDTWEAIIDANSGKTIRQIEKWL